MNHVCYKKYFNSNVSLIFIFNDSYVKDRLTRGLTDEDTGRLCFIAISFVKIFSDTDTFFFYFSVCVVVPLNFNSHNNGNIFSLLFSQNYFFAFIIYTTITKNSARSRLCIVLKKIKKMIKSTPIFNCLCLSCISQYGNESMLGLVSQKWCPVKFFKA